MVSRTHDIPHGTVSHAALYPMQHGIPHGTASNTTWYPTPRGTSHSPSHDDTPPHARAGWLDASGLDVTFGSASEPAGAQPSESASEPQHGTGPADHTLEQVTSGPAPLSSVACAAQRRRAAACCAPPVASCPAVRRLLHAAQQAVLKMTKELSSAWERADGW
jgi:hypothetical protein